MKNIKLTIAYDGKRYLGWQRLADSEKTIQGKLESVLSKLTGEKVEIIGSGRTDAGTHAHGQVANFKSNTKLDVQQLLTQLNHSLPQDIVVKQIAEMPERFHARYHVLGKKYSYYVWNDAIPSVFERNYSFHFPQELALEKMNEACQQLIGTHDFLGFSSLKKTKKSTVRTLEKVHIESEGNMLKFIFVGDGFLYNMVRIMMGTLLEIGCDRLPNQAIDQVFISQDRQHAGITVPAQGLFLDEVYY